MRWRDEPALEPAWLVPVLLAAAATCVTAESIPLVLAMTAVASVPWVLGLTGRVLPGWSFGLLGLLPVVVVLVLDGVSAIVFVGTTSLCHLASRAVRPWQLVVLAVVGAGLPFFAYVGGPPFDPGAIYFAIGDLFGIMVGGLLGRARQLGEELRAADARLAALRVQDERTRLARDVHDLVAHSLTVVMLHLGGARRVLRTDPERAETALRQAERVGRESLDGIREVVGLLRSSDETPRGSLAIASLVETYRAAAVEIDFVDDGSADLPLLVRGTLYRVAQEALANAARYRPGGSVVGVTVDVGTGDVATLRVTNPGGPGRRTVPGGYGLAGLHEQVTAVGGTLVSGPVDGGWLVECRLPRDASVLRSDEVTP